MARKAVVCDDDRTMSTIVGRILSKAGFTVATADNGADGLALVRREQPALLMLDLDMPVMDGWAVLREMKDMPNRPYTIVLSAHESADKHEMARVLGANDVLIKPFTPPDFLKKVEDLTKSGKL
jgi:DNA-binding response OmpR family regulator